MADFTLLQKEIIILLAIKQYKLHGHSSNNAESNEIILTLKGNLDTASKWNELQTYIENDQQQSAFQQIVSNEIALANQSLTSESDRFDLGALKKQFHNVA